MITVPAAFKNNQIDATRRAAKLAGFEHAEFYKNQLQPQWLTVLETVKKTAFGWFMTLVEEHLMRLLLKVEDRYYESC